MASYKEPRSWKFRQRLSNDEHALLDGLRDSTGLTDLTLKVCLARGYRTFEQIEHFLKPELKFLSSPFTIKDMKKAAMRVADAKDNKELVFIFGDYDVDGTTGAALLTWVMREFGVRSETRQPNRFSDGYGLNVKAVEEAHALGAKIVLTVDCGITSFEAASLANELGMDLIVLDHHQIDSNKGLPIGFAIVDPQRDDCESGLKEVCGCGMAFYFAMALRSVGRKRGWFSNGTEPNLKKHLDLVVMATAADMVPLIKDNHVLVRHGLQVLKTSSKPGVNALLKVAGLSSKEITPGTLGFTIGPRINASGRMGSASLALELLTTTDRDRANEIALELEGLNQKRMSIQNQIWDEVRERVEAEIAEGLHEFGVVVADEHWHEGVVGIVASRVTEFFRRPAVVISLENGKGKGSVRSYAGKNVLKALREASDTLISFGGHEHAAGLSLKETDLDEFREWFNDALSKMREDETQKPLYLDEAVSLKDLDMKTLGELERMGPFGIGNPEPVFRIDAMAHGTWVIKERHLKMRLGEHDQSIDAIWFNAAENPEIAESQGTAIEGKNYQWAGVAEINRFRGSAKPVFRVKEFRSIR